MIERIDGLDADVVGMRVTGRFSVDDYVDSIEPEIDRLEETGDLRLLLHLGPEFDGFGDGAWGELTDELRRMRFDRGAVVTDDVAVRTGLALLRWTLHGRSVASATTTTRRPWLGSRHVDFKLTSTRSLHRRE